MEHLLTLGHRRIGFACGRTDLNDRALQRRTAFERRLKEFGIEPDPELIFECAFEFVEGRAAMRRMLHLKRPPTAVFCANDILSYRRPSECREVGLSVPADMSIAGFDDLPIAQYVNPMLTTVRVPADEMGSSAAKRLIFAMRTRTCSTARIVYRLVIRESTAVPRGNRKL